jgi:hypothetical protein
VDALVAARCAAQGAITELVWGAGELRAAGVENTLMHGVESSGDGGAGGAGSPETGVGRVMDREVKERAQRAPEAMERVVVVDDI